MFFLQRADESLILLTPLLPSHDSDPSPSTAATAHLESGKYDKRESLDQPDHRLVCVCKVKGGGGDAFLSSAELSVCSLLLEPVGSGQVRGAAEPEETVLPGAFASLLAWQPKMLVVKVLVFRQLLKDPVSVPVSPGLFSWLPPASRTPFTLRTTFPLPRSTSSPANTSTALSVAACCMCVCI